MKSIEHYYREAGEWGDDQYESLRVSRNRMWVFAVICLFVAGGAVVAVAALAPLKEIEPYVIEVNNISGRVTVNQSLKDKVAYTAENLVSEHFISKYIRECEGFDHKYKNDWYRNCQLMSGEKVASRYIDFMTNNPASPNKVLREGETREVFIKSIVKLNDYAVHVRFSTTDYLKGIKNPIVKDWAAVLDFSWGKKLVDQEDSQYRYINPLGFYVTKYRKDQELIKGRPGDAS